MEEILEFLKKLACNNNREWFAEHKEEYLQVKAKVEAFTTELMTRMLPFEPDVARLSVADCTYRIYRDTRFSQDKTPYKTHIGIFINPPFGKKTNRMGYYLHIEPGQSFVCAGTVCLPTPTLTAIRRSIFDNIDEYLEIIHNPEFMAFYPSIGMNFLKTAPKGFSRDWEYLDLVRPKDFILEHKLTDRQMKSKQLLDIATEAFRIAKPWCDFINYTIDEQDN
ncbi:MAG: DUF2461 domain-containing protein [Muribaculaceae bacterium]|nr:DUF2461 domain-containing protein [Muribaculaceae bacterium]